MILIKTSEENIIAEYVCNHDITMYQITVHSILSHYNACFTGYNRYCFKRKNKEKNKWDKASLINWRVEIDDNKAEEKDTILHISGRKVDWFSHCIKQYYSQNN